MTTAKSSKIISQEDVVDLQPKTTREWFQHLNAKFDIMLKRQDETEAMLNEYIDKTDDWIKCHDGDLSVNLRRLERHDEKIGQLESKINNWNLINSLGVVIAAILAALGLTRS